MFDLQDQTLTQSMKGSPEDRLPSSPVPEQPAPPDDPLDTDAMHELHGRLISFYRLELDRQGPNRNEQAIDEDYYDNIQYTIEQKQELEDRGQAAIAYNVISQTLNWIIGSEKRGRTDYKILPRGKEDAKPALGKTKYMKYLSDVNRTPFHRSRAFADTVKVGIGWLECGVQDEDDGEPLYLRYESWRNMLWDSAGTELDGSDQRYQFRSKWVDEDIAIALFPNRVTQVKNSVTDSTMYGSFELLDGDFAMDAIEAEMENAGSAGAINVHRRARVRLIEVQYRVPEQVKRLRGGPFSGDVMDERDPRHQESVDKGYSVVIDKVMMRTRCAIITPSHILYDGPSPYRHNKFKFVPIWGYRRGRDNMPYGPTRGLRDIQDDINKRASKALHILSSNKVIMDKNAVDDLDEFADEVSKPNAIIIKNPGKELVLNADRDLSEAHLDLMSRNIQMIQQVGGVTDELLGRSTNAVSGVAVQRRQEQGSIATSQLFDNLRLGVQMCGELELANMEQFVTEQKQFRITNQRGTPEFVQINDGLPENDITRSKADFIISEADWRATMRQAQTDQLVEMMGKMPPQVALVMLDLVIDSMDIENRDEIVKRIRSVNGQQDPDAHEQTPEEAQAMQAKAEQDGAQKAMFEAELTKKRGEADKAGADANRIVAETERIKAETERTRRLMIGDSMDAADKAMIAAQAVIMMPATAKVADNLLNGAGWKGAHVAAGGLPPPAVPPEVAQAMQQQQIARAQQMHQEQAYAQSQSQQQAAPAPDMQASPPPPASLPPAQP